MATPSYIDSFNESGQGIPSRSYSSLIHRSNLLEITASTVPGIGSLPFNASDFR
jgi:hypothetical protein